MVNNKSRHHLHALFKHLITISGYEPLQQVFISVSDDEHRRPMNDSLNRKKLM